MPFRRLHTTLVLAVLAMLSAASACREAPPVLKVGCQGDGVMRQSLELAIQTVRQSGSPVRIELVHDETRGWTPASVVRCTEMFCQDPEILAVIGFASSDASLAAARMLNRQGIPQIIPTATSPKLLDIGPWTFKLCPNDTNQARFLAETAWQQFGARRCAVVFQNSDYGRGLSGLFQEQFERLGGEVPFTALLGSGYTKPATVELYVRLIIEQEPDLLVLLCQPQQALKVQEELIRRGIVLPMLGSDSMSTSRMMGKIARKFEGLPLTLFYHPELPHPGNAAFVERYRQNMARPPGYEAALAHDALLLLHQAVLEGARSRADVRNYLAGLSGDHAPFPGVAGPIIFNSDREVERPLLLGLIRNGSLILPPPGPQGTEGGNR